MPSQLNRMHGVTTLDDATVVELVEAATSRITAARGDSRDPYAREMSLAITALEDAQMRFTRGMAMKHELFAPADLERRVRDDVVVLGTVAYGPREAPVPVIAVGVRVRTALQPNDKVEGLHGREGRVSRIDTTRDLDNQADGYTILVDITGDAPVSDGHRYEAWFKPSELLVIA
jgi:hypothetical protein